MRHDQHPLPADIELRLNAAARVLEHDPRIVFSYLFGGLARGRASGLSDVDIAIWLDDDADFISARLDLVGALMHALGTDAVDVVILNQAPIALAGRVLQSSRVLADKNPVRRHAYESLTRREFFDFEYTEKKTLHARYGFGG